MFRFLHHRMINYVYYVMYTLYINIIIIITIVIIETMVMKYITENLFNCSLLTLFNPLLCLSWKIPTDLQNQLFKITSKSLTLLLFIIEMGKYTLYILQAVEQIGSVWATHVIDSEFDSYLGWHVITWLLPAGGNSTSKWVASGE